MGEKPTTLIALFKVLSDLEGVWFWRGIPDRTWLIDSSLARLMRRERHISHPNERVARYKEKVLIERARHRGFDVLEGVRLSDFEVLARLRHYGAATRLIDFSRSATVALWFASVEQPESIGRLLGLHTDHLGGHEGNPIGDSYDDVMDMIDKHHGPFTWEPMRVTPRVSAQHSQFVFGKMVDGDSGSIELPYDKQPGVVDIEVAPSVKREALSFLRNVLDIWQPAMFPDLEGFALSFGVSPPEDPYRW